MKTTKTMPKDGQFVAVWKHDGKMWADTLRWHKGVLLEWRDGEWFDNEDEEFYTRQQADFIGG